MGKMDFSKLMSDGAVTKSKGLKIQRGMTDTFKKMGRLPARVDWLTCIHSPALPCSLSQAPEFR